MTIDPALVHCAEITHRKPNHLASAAAQFEDPRRRELFYCSYAAMRVADDLVDEEFLGSAPAERQGKRADVRRTLDLWLEQALKANRGRFDAAASGAYEPRVFEALNARLPSTHLGEEPWRALHRSLRRDVDERPIADWDDFLDYAEGACIAPASIFVYLAGCHFHDDGSSGFRATHGPRELARDLALFSYLVHLRRDLVEDARRDGQLVLLPISWIERCGLSKAEALERIRRGALGSLGGALSRVQEETEALRNAVLTKLDIAASDLGHQPARILRQVFERYDETRSALAVAKP